MKLLEPFFKKIIFQLIDCKVSFMIIGGYAVNYYGYNHYTGDIDFWLKPDNANKLKLIDSFIELGRNINDVGPIMTLDFESEQFISIGEPPLRIDFFNKVNHLNFDDAWEKKQEWPLENYQLPILNYHHLILSKINTGRTKDQLDIEELQKINGNIILKSPKCN